MKYSSYIGDCQLPLACKTFIQEYGPRILENNLARNVLLHLTNLYDFDLIRSDVIVRTMCQLFRLREKLAYEKQRQEDTQAWIQGQGSGRLDIVNNNADSSDQGPSFPSESQAK